MFLECSLCFRSCLCFLCNNLLLFGCIDQLIVMVAAHNAVAEAALVASSGHRGRCAGDCGQRRCIAGHAGGQGEGIKA